MLSTSSMFISNTFKSFQEIFKATKQTGKIFSLAWSPTSEHFATGSLNGTVAVWGLKPGYDNVTHYENFAHRKETVMGIAWLSDKEFVTSGTDCCIRQWTLVDEVKGKGVK